MTKIENYLKRFEAYKNGDLNSQEVSSFKRDLEKDPEMHKAWKEYLSIMESLSDKEAVSLRELLENIYDRNFTKRQYLFSKTKWLNASAAALVIIATGTLLYFFCARTDLYKDSINQTLQVKNDNIEAQISEDTLASEISNVKPDKTDRVPKADNQKNHQINKRETFATIYEREEYQINPIYKELLNSIYRGSWFSIISPEDTVMLGPNESLVFNWETNISDSIYFDILDRNGIVIYKHKTAVNSPFTVEIKLSPAIYMYRFSTIEEPLYLGVVVIREISF